MLGGSVYIAFIRFAISLAGVILLFSRICESRFDRKKQLFVMDVSVWWCLYWCLSGMWWIGKVVCGSWHLRYLLVLQYLP